MSDTDQATSSSNGGRTVRQSLRDQRKAVRAKLFTDIQVPRYDPPVFVRCNPVSGQRVEKAQKALTKSKAPDRAVAAAAAVLAEACVGVCELVDGKKVSIDRDDPDGTWPKFDHDLVEIAGLEALPERAGDVVREFFFTEGDVMSAVGELYEFSGFSDEKIEADYLGN